MIALNIALCTEGMTDIGNSLESLVSVPPSDEEPSTLQWIPHRQNKLQHHFSPLIVYEFGQNQT